MKKTLALLVGAAMVIALGYAGYRLLWPNEEDRLRSALEAAARIASTPEREGDLPRLARIQRIRDYLVEELLVEVEGGPVFGGREAIVEALAGASAVGRLEVRFADVSVSMDAGERRATVNATIEVEQANPRGSANVDAREVEMTWTRPGSAWMLERARVVRPLK